MPFSYKLFGRMVNKMCLASETHTIEVWLNCCEVRNVDDDDDGDGDGDDNDGDGDGGGGGGGGGDGGDDDDDEEEEEEEEEDDEEDEFLKDCSNLCIRELGLMMCSVNSVSLGSTARLSHLATLPMWLLALQCFCVSIRNMVS
jgi:hypothetical protein